MRHYRFLSRLVCLLFALVSTSGAARTQSPNAVTLTLNNPYCVQASPASSTCLINIRYLSAASSDPTFRGVQITINGKPRAFFWNYSETSVFINDSMMGKGLQVTCGKPNASGLPGYGLQYNVGFSAIISGSSTTDNAIVNCPSFESRVYMPRVNK
jgi:hypothetical protein